MQRMNWNDMRWALWVAWLSQKGVAESHSCVLLGRDDDSNLRCALGLDGLNRVSEGDSQ